MITVKVPERRRRRLDPSVWRALEHQSDFWTLRDRGVVKVHALGPNVVELEGTRYVGRCEIGEVTLEFVEKIEGALASLLGYAASDSFRLLLTDAPASKLGDLAVLLLREFIARARAYVTAGIQFRYVPLQDEGTLAAGRLDVPGTVALRARGKLHRAAFRRSVIVRDLPINKVLLAALREVERLAQILPVPSGDLAQARGLCLYLDEARTADVLFGRRADWADRARTLASEWEDAQQRDLLALAAVVLSHESFEASDLLGSRVPRSWFLNLEHLFEVAVRRELQTVLHDRADVEPGSATHPRIFDRGESFGADPDIVVRPHAVGAVGDVKYKDWPGAEGVQKLHADLYQLLVHAAAFGAPLAFLVFPHNRYEKRYLGRSATGCDTWITAVDVRDLESGTQALVSDLGLCCDRQQASAVQVIT